MFDITYSGHRRFGSTCLILQIPGKVGLVVHV